jgi:hypothetical protein
MICPTFSYKLTNIALNVVKVGVLTKFRCICLLMLATTKKRYNDTAIQSYRNRNLEPEPGTVHNLCILEHFAPQEIYIIITYRGVGRNSMIV